MLPYPKFVAFVKQVFALTLRKTRLENLQLLAYGIMRGQSCCLSRIARFCPLPTDHNHRLRRLWRFLRNPGFLPEHVYPQLLRALAPGWPASLPLPIALDWTSAGGYELLVASLPYLAWRGRALPLWALCWAGRGGGRACAPAATTWRKPSSAPSLLPCGPPALTCAQSGSPTGASPG